jgi:hypothetical protein
LFEVSKFRGLRKRRRWCQGKISNEESLSLNKKEDVLKKAI